MPARADRGGHRQRLREDGRRADERHRRSRRVSRRRRTRRARGRRPDRGPVLPEHRGVRLRHRGARGHRDASSGCAATRSTSTRRCGSSSATAASTSPSRRSAGRRADRAAPDAGHREREELRRRVQDRAGGVAVGREAGRDRDPRFVGAAARCRCSSAAMQGTHDHQPGVVIEQAPSFCADVRGAAGVRDRRRVPPGEERGARGELRAGGAARGAWCLAMRDAPSEQRVKCIRSWLPLNRASAQPRTVHRLYALSGSGTSRPVRADS